MTFPRVILTGAAGWLGRGVANALANGPDNESDNNGRGPESKSAPPFPEAELVASDIAPPGFAPPGFREVRGDLRDPDFCRKLMDGEAGALVLHCAGIIHPRRVADFYEVNLRAAQNLFAAARDAQAARVVVVSSNSPCGCNPKRGELFDETSPHRPYMHYGRSKMMMERFVREQDAPEWTLIRAPWFYGPFQPPRQTLFFKMIRDGKGPIVGDGDNLRSMSYIGNLAAGILLAARSPKAAGETYWIADAEPYTMNQVVDSVERLLEEEFAIPCKRERLRLPGAAAEVALLCDKLIQATGLYHQKIHVLSEMNKNIACSIEKARRELGYNPTVALEEGMRRSIADLIARGEDLSGNDSRLSGSDDAKAKARPQARAAGCESWGRFPKHPQTVRAFHWRDEKITAPPDGRAMLPRGLGRSYGDSCLAAAGGELIDAAPLDRIISLDSESGILRCESGASLDAILQFVVPRGWFPPVTPGTRFVTVGGAIANDVHGKNHPRRGSFGNHVRRLQLLRSDGARFECAPDQNPEWFRAVVGGLGLPGFIVWAEIQLRRIRNPFVETEFIRMNSLPDFFRLFSESAPDFEYPVAWIDCVGKNIGRGWFYRANHASPDSRGKIPSARKRTAPPLPFSLVNAATVPAFNFLYRALPRPARAVSHYRPFFYPLDSLLKWNRLYGPRGFVQWQCAVPPGDGEEVLREILSRVSETGIASPLTALKMFGDIPPAGLMSFPRPGPTLAMDFPRVGPVAELLHKLDDIAAGAGGAVYPAKDARMRGAMFQKFFPQWRELESFRDPAILSAFWARVCDEKERSAIVKKVPPNSGTGSESVPASGLASGTVPESDPVSGSVPGSVPRPVPESDPTSPSVPESNSKPQGGFPR